MYVSIFIRKNVRSRIKFTICCLHFFLARDIINKPWCRSIITAFRRLKWDFPYKFKATLGYIASSQATVGKSEILSQQTDK